MTTAPPAPDLCKEAHAAGAQQALCALGLLPAPEAPLEKEAFLKALWGLGKGLYKHVARPLVSGTARGAGAVSSGLTSVAAKPLEHAGRGILSTAPKAWRPALETVGKGLPRQMAGFGLLSGAIEGSNVIPAAFGQGELGWDWGRAAKGFGQGALLGAGFGAAGNVYKAGLGKLVGKGGMGALERAASPGWFGGFARRGAGGMGPAMAPGAAAARGLKGLGSNLALGGGAFVAGDLAMSPFLGGSVTGSVYDMLKGQPEQQARPIYAYPQAYAPVLGAAGRGSRYALGRVGLTPYNPGYTPGMTAYQQ